MDKKVFLLSLGALLLVLFSNSFFIIEQHQQALVLQLGEVTRVIQTPGLKMKIPFIQKIERFDKRIQNLSADEKEVIAKDQKRLIVDAFAKFRIVDPLKFYQTVRDENGLRFRLNSVLDSSLRQVLGSVPLGTLLTGERSVIMDNIQHLVDSQAASFGIDIIDVRIMHADLPKENSEAIYKRMQTEREKEAKEFRAEGIEESERIKSRADKEQKIILAEAKKKAQIIRGEGDAISAKTYAEAYNKDPQFFHFYRSLQAYQHSLRKTDTTVILSPDSPFLRFFSAQPHHND